MGLGLLLIPSLGGYWFFGTSTLCFPGRKCPQLAYSIRKRIDCFSNPIDDERCARYSATSVVVSPAAKAFM